MSRSIKTFIVVFIIAGVILLVLYYTGRNAFIGKIDKESSRKELTGYFIQHEAEFADLVSYFTSQVNDKEYTISFGLEKDDRVSLIIPPIVTDPANKAIGGENLKIGSPELDSALQLLKWTNQTVQTLKDKLSKTNCDWIRTTEIHSEPIEIYSNQSGWGSFSYLVFKTPVADSLVQIHGKPIDNSDFGSRVVLNYSSAL